MENGSGGIVGVVSEHLADMRRRGLAKGSIEKRRYHLAAFRNWLGGDLMSATTDDVNAFLDQRRWRGKEIGERARYQWLSQLSSFYTWAIDHGHATDDPTARIHRPKMRRLLPRPIQTGDLMMAIDAATPTMRAWLSLAAFAGLRCAEIAALDVDGVMFDERLLRVLGKGGKERIVPMHPKVREALLADGVPARGAVFRRPRGGRYPAAMISRETSEYLHGLGIDATAHQLRHWFGTHTFAACKDLRVVQELLGHASPSTSAIYTAWSKTEARRAVDALGADDDQSSLFTDHPK